MSGNVNFTWDKTPVDLGKAIERHGQLTAARVVTALRAEAASSAADMKRGRPWRDVTGNAKRGLRGEVEASGPRLTLYLIHSVEYGKELELARAGRYAVILPTLHGKTIPRLQRRLKGVAGK